MSTLRITDPEVRQLAYELAERRHVSLTVAVKQALQESLDATTPPGREGIAARLLEIGRRSAEQARAERITFLTDDDLYDENGLPR